MVLKPKAVRCLFGSPNHDHVEEELKSKLKEMSIKENQRWNFDFISDSPLRGRFNWTPLQIDPDSYVPSFYTTERVYSSSKARKFSRKHTKRPFSSVVGLSYSQLPEDNYVIENEDVPKTYSPQDVNISTIRAGNSLSINHGKVKKPQWGLHKKPKRRKLCKTRSYVMKPMQKQTTLTSLFRVTKSSVRRDPPPTVLSVKSSNTAR